MENKKPLVSVITVCFNAEKTLEKSIQSVIGQSYEPIEYIIIDGGSIDNTLNIIKKNEDKISYWLSEPDKGIYDAMNKGLSMAKGEYIAILNADDYYHRDAIEHSIDKIIATKSDYSISNVKYVDGKMIRPIYPLQENYVYQEMPYPHVGALIAKSIFQKIGNFDNTLKIAGDHDMAVRIHLADYKACYLDEITATLEEGGISSDLESNKESMSVAIKHGKNRIMALLVYIKQLSSIYLFRFLPASIVMRLQKIKGSRFQ